MKEKKEAQDSCESWRTCDTKQVSKVLGLGLGLESKKVVLILSIQNKILFSFQKPKMVYNFTDQCEMLPIKC